MSEIPYEKALGESGKEKLNFNRKKQKSPDCDSAAFEPFRGGPTGVFQIIALPKCS